VEGGRPREKSKADGEKDRLQLKKKACRRLGKGGEGQKCAWDYTFSCEKQFVHIPKRKAKEGGFFEMQKNLKDG